MTDVSKAMELLELAEKWLEPFGVTDPFSKLRLEGYLSLKPDYRYGALALLKVGGKEAPQRILATPKLHYPFDRAGAFHFPSVRQIDIYEKKVFRSRYLWALPVGNDFLWIYTKGYSKTGKIFVK